MKTHDSFLCGPAGRALRRGCAIMPRGWSDLPHVLRRTRTKFVRRHPCADHGETKPSRMDGDDPARAHARQHGLQCAMLMRSAQSGQNGYATGGAAAERAEDEDLAGRTELPGFGSANFPSPTTLQTAPRQFAPVPESCRSGSSLRRKPDHPRQRPARPRQRMFAARGSPDPAHGGCPESSVTPFRQTISPQRLPRGARSRTNLLGDISRVGTENQVAARMLCTQYPLSASFTSMSRQLSFASQE